MELKKRTEFSSDSTWLQKLADGLVSDKAIADDSLEWLEQALRGHYGAEYSKIGENHDAHVRFWGRLADSFPERPRLRAIFADTMLISGLDKRQCLGEFLSAVHLEPQLFPEFAGDFSLVARDLGGDAWLNFRLGELRFTADTSADDWDQEETHELTRELLMEFGADVAAIARIKACAHPAKE